MRALLLVIALFCVTGYAAAGFRGSVPEPGVIELLSIGAIAGLIVAIRKRRK